MKRFIFIILIIVLLASFCGCNPKNYTVTLDYGYEVITDVGLRYDRFVDSSNKSEKETIDADSYYSPPRPSRSGYTFKGWFKDSACTVPWINGEDKVISDITLYANWEKID